jgi:Flp pilus assembly pilin Flp
MQILESLSRDENGASTSEYALLLCLIASVTIVALNNLTGHVDGIFSLAADKLGSVF